jgi:hypothetical protein
MNSYLRSALNVRDVRTVYNVLNQYRLLVQAMLRTGNSATALQGVKHMIYYGHVGFDMQLDFVTETVAYDISALCQYANEVKSDVEDDILSILLHLDQPKRAHHEDRAFFGVRKAQVKLAAYYLVEGEEERARVISRDLAHEDAGRLTTIRDSLQSVTSKDFWEIIDRGRNFEYMPETHRQALDTFFSWLNLPAHGA